MIRSQRSKGEPEKGNFLPERGKNQGNDRDFEGDIFFVKKRGKMLSYPSFLYTQLRLIRKRWWLLQGFILTALWAVLPLAKDMMYAYRSMGVAAALFVILIIPELWKNRTCQCMEIESAAYYTLRQIYSARMLPVRHRRHLSRHGVSAAPAALSLSLSLTDLLTQFLFPMAVTACICFGIFCSRRAFSETAAVGMCAVWSAVWWFILLNEQIYAAVTLPVWAALFGAALLFICFAVCRSIRRCGSIWEEYSDGTQNDKTLRSNSVILPRWITWISP